MRFVGPISALLVLVTVAVFYPTLGHGFVSLDDYDFILRHPQVQTGPSLDSLLRAFTTPYHTSWHPLTVFSLQLDYALWGEQAAGYHLTNLLLHQASVLLLFWALARMTGAVWPSAFVAAVFAIHPQHVESVAWASERKDVLAGLFWMLTLWAWARYAEAPGIRRYLLALGFLAMGLLAKPMLVTLPFVLLLLDFWPLGRLGVGENFDLRRLRRTLIEKLPMLGIAAGVGVITLLSQRSGGATDLLPGLTLPLRLANAVHSYAVYLAKSFWPTDLAVFYPHPVADISLGEVGLAALVLVGITAACAAWVRSRPFALVGWLWYLGTLLPVIGIAQVGLQARADRYTYIPMIGLSILVAWTAQDLLRSGRVKQRPLAAVGALAVVSLALCASLQVSTWRNSVRLFEHALSVNEENHVAHAHLSAILISQGRFDRAEHHAREALRLLPSAVGNQMAMLNVRKAQGNLEEMIRHYQAILEIAPDLENIEVIHHDLGFALIRSRRPVEAGPHLARVVAANPELPHVYVGLALVAEASHDFEGAADYYREALVRVPNMRFAANNLARILIDCRSDRLCDREEAIRLIKAAAEQRVHPDPVLLNTLAAAYRALGRQAEAERSETQARAAAANSVASSYSVDLLLRDLGVTVVFGGDASR